MGEIMRKEDINLTGLNLYLYATIDWKAKGVNNTIQRSISTSDVLFFSLLPLTGILGESKAE